MTRESFIIHRSFFEPVRDMTNEEKGILYDTLCEYALNGIDPENIPPTVRLAFNFISPVIDWDYVKFQETVVRNQVNGRKGGRPIKNPKEPKKPSGLSGLSEKTQANPPEPKKPDSDSVSGSGIKKKEKKEKTKIFIPPSFLEIEEYFANTIANKGKNLDAKIEAEKFDAHYGSIGWKVGKIKMTNWKKSASGWILRATEFQGQSRQPNGKQSSNEVFTPQSFLS